MDQDKPIAKLQQFLKSNPNTAYEMDEGLLRILANGNTQFIIDLCRQLEMGYSVPTLAIHISHVFFNKMCYINYDRFLVLAACVLIALKVKDVNIAIKRLCNAFYSVIIRLNKSMDPYNEKKFQLVKDQICKVESLIYRTLEYSTDFKLPLEFVDKYLKMLIPDKKKAKIHFTCRVLIVDSYRTFASMLFNPLVVFMAALLISCRYQKINAFDCPFVKNSSKVQPDGTEEHFYYKMLQIIQQAQQMPLKAEDVRDCIIQMNKLFDLFMRYENPIQE